MKLSHSSQSCRLKSKNSRTSSEDQTAEASHVGGSTASRNLDRASGGGRWLRWGVVGGSTLGLHGRRSVASRSDHGDVLGWGNVSRSSSLWWGDRARSDYGGALSWVRGGVGLGDGAGAVLDGKGGGLGDGVGLVASRERGGVWAVGGVVGDELGGVLGSLGGLGAVRWGSGRAGAGAVRWGGSSAGLLGGGGGGALVVGVGDAELGGVLVLASGVVDQLDTIALSIVGGLKVAGDVPDVGTAVWNLLGDSVLRNSIAARALKENEVDGALGGWLPGNGEVLAGGDDRVEAWLGDGVALLSRSLV